MTPRSSSMVCAVNQAAYLLKRQIESQGREFMAEGGFTENLYRQRRQARSRGQGRGRPGEPDVSDKSD